MSDLISREAVIDTLKLLRSSSVSVYEYEKYILGMPSANQWIPCEERLPEVGKEVLVTVWDDVKIAHFNIRWADGEQEWCFEEFDLNGEDFDDVKAWCELPKPYERRTE